MRAFILISCLAMTAVMARPEPPVPYLSMQQQSLPPNSHPAKPHVYQQLPTDLSYMNFAVPAANNIPATNDQMIATPEMSAQEEDSYNAAYRHSTSVQHQSGYANGPAETQVHKHIYVHVPPKDFEEEEAIQPRVTHQMAPKQKHYKIVFIKAPTAPAMRAPIVAPAPQNEEKTLIYVLHKKPEAQPDIVIPAPAPTKPSKPEVFFIKYKTKKEEAPVYGPPPTSYNSEPRQAAAEPSVEYNAPLSNEVADFAPMDFSQYEQQPQAVEMPVEESQPQFMNVERTPKEYVDPSMSAFVGESVQPTAAETETQYLAPENPSIPIVVAEPEEQVHVPAATYGPANRYLIKRRK